MSRRTLSNLGIHLDVVGRREGAFAPTEQAVEHYGGWPRPTPPPTCPTSPCR
jgi:hypothetical protein